jgi:hypothetical protein
VQFGEHELVVAGAYPELRLINLSLLLIAVALDEEVEILHQVIWLPAPVNEGLLYVAMGTFEAQGSPLAEAWHIPADVLRPLMLLGHHTVFNVR